MDPTILTSSMISKVKCDSLITFQSIQLVMVKRLKPIILRPSSSAERKVMPLILNAATPVGTVSNTSSPVGTVSNTSSGSKVPESLRSLRVSECTNHMTWDFPTPPGPLHDKVLQLQTAPVSMQLLPFLYQLRWYMTVSICLVFNCLKSPVLIGRDFLLVEPSDLIFRPVGPDPDLF